MAVGVVGGVGVLAVGLAACGPTIRPDFNSPEPAARNDAIVRAAANKDRAAVPDLVRMLQSDDPATRLLAIEALEVITGQRLGYDSSDDEQSRMKAVARWKAFVEGDGGGEPASVPAKAGTPPA